MAEQRDGSAAVRLLILLFAAGMSLVSAFGPASAATGCRPAAEVSADDIKSELVKDTPAGTAWQHAQHRVAIVVGNDYEFDLALDESSPFDAIPNALNDAKLVAEKLDSSTLGYRVLCVLNADFQQMNKLLRAVHTIIEGLDSPLGSVILFYYAGHGYSDDFGRLFIAANQRDFDHRRHQIAVEELRSQLWPHDESSVIFILDMCRSAVHVPLGGNRTSKETMSMVQAAPAGSSPAAIGFLFAAWPGSAAQNSHVNRATNGAFTWEFKSALERTPITAHDLSLDIWQGFIRNEIAQRPYLEGAPPALSVEWATGNKPWICRDRSYIARTEPVKCEDILKIEPLAELCGSDPTYDARLAQCRAARSSPVVSILRLPSSGTDLAARYQAILQSSLRTGAGSVHTTYIPNAVVDVEASSLRIRERPDLGAETMAAFANDSTVTLANPVQMTDEEKSVALGGVDWVGVYNTQTAQLGYVQASGIREAAPAASFEITLSEGQDGWAPGQLSLINSVRERAIALGPNARVRVLSEANAAAGEDAVTRAFAHGISVRNLLTGGLGAAEPLDSDHVALDYRSSPSLSNDRVQIGIFLDTP